MLEPKNYIIIYLDTNLIPLSKNLDKPVKEVHNLLREIFLLKSNNEITIRTTQGSFDEITKNLNYKNTNVAMNRITSKQLWTNPVAEDYLESSEDFSIEDIKLFRIMFKNKFQNISEKNIYCCLLGLKDNDRKDYQIIRACMESSNLISYFLTTNKKDFIINDKDKELESFAVNEKNSNFKIRELNKKTIAEIENDIIDFKNFYEKNI